MCVRMFLQRSQTGSGLVVHGNFVSFRTFISSLGRPQRPSPVMLAPINESPNMLLHDSSDDFIAHLDLANVVLV